jgi:hypothetical protein
MYCKVLKTYKRKLCHILPPAHQMVPTAYYIRIEYCLHILTALQLTIYLTNFINFITFIHKLLIYTFYTPIQFLFFLLRLYVKILRVLCTDTCTIYYSCEGEDLHP